MMKRIFGESEALNRAKAGALAAGRAVGKALLFNPVSEALVPRRQVAVSLGIDFLSIAHGTRLLNRIRILDYEMHRFQERRCPAPEAVAGAVLQYCRRANLKSPDVMLCVPKAWSVIREAELPAAARENLAEVVSFELDRITPYSSDEAYFDFRVLTEGNGTLRLAVTALKRDAVDPYIRALGEKGLPVGRMETNLSASSVYLNYIWQERDLIYLDIHPGAFEAGFLRQGVVVAGCAGSFNGAGPDERVLADVAEEVGPWIADLKARDVAPRVMVHGHADVRYEPLEERLRIPLEVLNDGDLAIPGYRGERGGKDVPHEAIGGVLASLWKKSKAMNLLHRGRTDRTRPPVALTAALVLLLLAMGGLALGLPLYRDHRMIAMIDQEVSSRKGEIKKIEALRKEHDGLRDELKAVADFKKTKPQALNILKELTVILPKSVWLTRVHVNDADVSVEGYATSATDILPLIEASPAFAKAEFTSPTIRDSRMNADRFVIRMEIEGMKTENAKVKNGKKQ